MRLKRSQTVKVRDEKYTHKILSSTSLVVPSDIFSERLMRTTEGGEGELYVCVHNTVNPLELETLAVVAFFKTGRNNTKETLGR